MAANNSDASGVIDSAKQTATQVAGQVKDQAGQVVEQVKGQATARADQQRETLASGFQSVAQAFHGLGTDLESREQSPVGQYAAQLGHAVGEQVENLANYLQSRDVRQVVRDLEDFARRSPAVFLGGAFLVGLAATRFLKSSRPAPDFTSNIPDPNRALPPANPEFSQRPEVWQRGATA
ncbi:MAG: hypothetical protein JO061_20695 [Acidobacteriaceae bacterium]|nr:hypothetical protein [Acidobacteriaceae bacterium]